MIDSGIKEKKVKVINNCIEACTTKRMEKLVEAIEDMDILG